MTTSPGAAPAAASGPASPVGPFQHATLDPEELADLRATVREIASAAGGPALGRTLENAWRGGGETPDHDVDAWRALSRDVGLGGLGLPEDAGGVGGLVELVAVAEELGAALTAVPFLSSTVLAGQVLARCGDAGLPWLHRVCEGEICTVATATADGLPARDGLLPARPDGDRGHVLLDGELLFVPDGLRAGAVVVPVETAHGCDLALVEADAPGLVRSSMRVLDFTRPQARLSLTGAPAVLLTRGGGGWTALAPALDVARLALAADQLGGMQRALDMTVEYVRTRRQFNRPIGSFQAVKHRLADALATVERARTSVERVTWEPLPAQALAQAACIAQAWCSEAFLAVAAETVHLHGGIGFTWEHDAHLYVRRARSDAALWGDAAWHRERLAGLLAW